MSWYGLVIICGKMYLNTTSLTFKQYCLENWTNIPLTRFAKLVETYLAGLIAAKGGFTKIWVFGR